MRVFGFDNWEKELSRLPAREEGSVDELWVAEVVVNPGERVSPRRLMEQGGAEYAGEQPGQLCVGVVWRDRRKHDGRCLLVLCVGCCQRTSERWTRERVLAKVTGGAQP